MERQLTRKEILNAKAIHLYCGDTVYVELNDKEDVYGICKDRKWFVKENFWDFFDSTLMLSYFQPLTAGKALELLEVWGCAPGL